MKGQVALIVLLVSAVVMTMGLSMSKKAIVETKIDTSEEQLKQAFNTAESGIDYYLGTGEKVYSGTDNSVAEVVVGDFGGGSDSTDYGEFVEENEVALFWLVGHNSDGEIDGGEGVYDGDNVSIEVDDGFGGSLKIDYFYKDGEEYKVKRYGFNYEAGRIANFRDEEAFVDISGTPLLLAITPIFEGTNFTLDGNGTFPAQGEEIRAVGKVADNSMGGVSQTVRVFERYKVPAFMLDGITAVNGSIE